MTDTWKHRGWTISADYSCPHHGSTWSAYSPDYDPIDPPVYSYAYAATYADLLAEIDWAIKEMAE